MTGKDESRLLVIPSSCRYLELEVIYLFSDPSFSFDFYIRVTRNYVTLYLRSQEVKLMNENRIIIKFQVGYFRLEIYLHNDVIIKCKVGSFFFEGK